MAVVTYSYIICFKGGLFGWLASWLALNAGSGLWAGYVFLACYLGELYFLLGATAGLATIIVQFIFATLYNPILPEPFGPIGASVCGGEYHQVYPSLGVAMLFQFWAIVVMHDLHLNIRVTLFTHAKRILVLVFVPLIIVWMGNATPRNAGFGIVLGLVIGLLIASLLLLLWLPRMPDIARFLRILNIDHQPEILERHDKTSEKYPKNVNPIFF